MTHKTSKRIDIGLLVLVGILLGVTLLCSGCADPVDDWTVSSNSDVKYYVGQGQELEALGTQTLGKMIIESEDDAAVRERQQLYMDGYLLDKDRISSDTQGREGTYGKYISNLLAPQNEDGTSNKTLLGILLGGGLLGGYGVGRNTKPTGGKK